MPVETLRRLMIAASLMLAVSLLSVIGGGVVDVTAAQATTSNPTCAATTGNDNDQLTACISATPSGLTFAWWGYTNYVGSDQLISYSGSDTSVNEQSVTCGAPTCSYSVSLPPGEYTGSATIETGLGPQAPEVEFDLIVSQSQPTSPTGSGLPVQRIYGQDAIGTSIAVSEAEYPNGGSAQAVVLARSDYFSDALAGGPLATAAGGPLLITQGASTSSALDSAVQSEIQRVLPSGGTVYVLGGPLALSSAIDTTLEGLGYEVKRVAGSDAYATAVAIAEQLGNPSTLFEATGTNFADALSAVPAAIQAHGAILLTDGSAQAPETATYLAAHPTDTRYAIGGPLAAAGADLSATAVWGEDLYATSAAVATKFFPTATTFGAATGVNFPDALSGGVFMGMTGHAGPMLLVEPSLPLPSSISDYLAEDPSMSNGYLFGGPLAVGDDVLAAL
ncbi:MAG: cell wall-binding repeat-containing protein [Acidimicrobiales bacterium]|jgi:putative cell wall-binding protein